MGEQRNPCKLPADCLRCSGAAPRRDPGWPRTCSLRTCGCAGPATLKMERATRRCAGPPRRLFPPRLSLIGGNGPPALLSGRLLASRPISRGTAPVRTSKQTSHSCLQRRRRGLLRAVRASLGRVLGTGAGLVRRPSQSKSATFSDFPAMQECAPPTFCWFADVFRPADRVPCCRVTVSGQKVSWVSFSQERTPVPRLLVKVPFCAGVQTRLVRMGLGELGPRPTPSEVALRE